MSTYEIFQYGARAFNEGDFKFLLVSKTSDEKDSMIIFGDVKTRHFILLFSWMRDNQLKEAYTFGGGKISVSLNERNKFIRFYGVSSDYNYTSKDLVERILENKTSNEAVFELDLPIYSIKAQLTSFGTAQV